jgi:hypothetical protein
MHGIARAQGSSGRLMSRVWEQVAPVFLAGLLSLGTGIASGPSARSQPPPTPQPFPNYRIVGAPAKSNYEIGQDRFVCTNLGPSHEFAGVVKCLTDLGYTVVLSDGTTYGPTQHAPQVAANRPAPVPVPSPNPTRENPANRSNETAIGNLGRALFDGDRTPTSGILSYGCTDQEGHQSTVTLDALRKTARESVRSGLFFCEITSVDGAVGPITTADRCNFPLLGGMTSQMRSRQSVKLDGDMATFGGYIIDAPVPLTDDERNQFNRLNLRTGVMENWDGTRSRCHALPRP